MGERRSVPNHSISSVFIFLLLGIFAVFSLVLVLFGAQAYRNTVERTAGHNNARILTSYIRNNLRTADTAGGITYNAEADVPCLMITDPDDEGEYVKYIYVVDGNLCELYTETSSGFNAEAGEIICSAEHLDVEFDGSMIIVRVTSDEIEYTTVFARHCGEETA